MPVTITISKPIILAHLIHELNLGGFTSLSVAPGDYIPESLTVFNSNDTAGVQSVYDATQEYYIEDYRVALQVFLDVTAINRGYDSEQDCLNGLGQVDDSQWNQDASTMLSYDLYCCRTLNGVFGYTGNSRLPGERQMNPPPPPSIDEFLNSTLNSISW